MKTYTEAELVALRDRHESWLMEQKGVTGTSVGLDAGGKIVLRVFTHGITEPTRRAIAERLQGVPLAWEEGEIIPY